MVINPRNEEDKECFKWAAFAASHHEGIDLHLEQISKLREFEGDLNWRGSEFSLPISKISIFKQNSNTSVNVLAIGEGKEKLYILRKA